MLTIKISRQDLLSAAIAGSERVFDHTTFPELQWSRDPVLRPLYTFPLGFMTVSHLLSPEIEELFEDIHAFQIMRDSPDFQFNDPASLIRLDNQQAWAESRLYNFRKALGHSDYMLECSLIAAYICTYFMYTDMWGGSLIPGRCSSQLFQRLQQNDLFETQWVGHEDLLLWLLCIGGAFAPRGSITRAEYVVLLNGTYFEQLGLLEEPWSEVETKLKGFIWSEKLFGDRCRLFWEECSA
jgi:hypothetical protein